MLSSSMRLSIIIPTRNRPKLLRRLLSSLRPQIGDGVEIVIYDDASYTPVDDALGDVLEDAPVQVVRGEERVGAAKGRNHAAEASSGEWLSFLDDDCWCGEDYVATLVSQLSPTSSPSYLLHPVRTYRDSSANEAIQDFPGSFGLGSMGWRVTTSMMALRRDLWETVGGFDPALPRWQDTDLAIRLSVFTRPVLALEPIACRTMPSGITADDGLLVSTSRHLLQSYETWFASNPALRADAHRYLALSLAQHALYREAQLHLSAALGLTNHPRLSDLVLRGAFLLRSPGLACVTHLDAFLRKRLGASLVPN